MFIYICIEEIYPYEHLNFDNLYRPYFLYPPTHTHARTHTHTHTHKHTHTHLYIYSCTLSLRHYGEVY